VRLRFHRDEASDCTARVVFPDLRKSASLAAFGTTTLDLAIDEPGEYAWACGMNMLHGTLIADPANGERTRLRDRAAQAQMPLSAPEQGGGEVVEAARGVAVRAAGTVPSASDSGHSSGESPVSTG
jgi:Cu+-exporting ATPase